MAESFMTICPRSKEYTGCNISGIPLKVIVDDGVEITPHIQFTEEDLQNGVKYFRNNSGQCDKFTVKCIFNKEDTVMLTKEYNDNTWQSEQGNFDTVVNLDMGSNSVYAKLGKREKVLTVIDYFIRRGEPFFVTTRAVGIKDTDLWLCTSNGTRTQSYDDGYVVWDLTFTKYVKYDYAVFKNTNTGVQNALNNYQKKKAQSKNKKKTAKKKTGKKSKFEKQCKASQLKYSSKKKNVACVKLMQQILNKQGCLDKKYITGWYHNNTKNGVKKFQKKYAKKYKLKQTGNVDNATFKALCNV